MLEELSLLRPNFFGGTDVGGVVPAASHVFFLVVQI